MAEAEQRKEEVQKKEEKAQKNWWSNLPTSYKIGGLFILAFALIALRNQGWTIKQSWLVIAAIIIAIYLLGKGRVDARNYYTPEEAMLLLEGLIEWQKQTGKIEQSTQYFIGPNIKLQKKKAIGYQYLIQAELLYADGLREYKKGYVNFFVPGIPQLVNADAPVRGDEEPDIRVIEPEALKYASKYGSSVFSKLFGGG